MNHFVASFIKKPIYPISMCIFILLFGLIGLMNLPLRFLPKIDQALINITSIYPGANSQVIKSFLTTKIQNAISGVEGIDYVTSMSTSGLSEINVYLKSDAISDKAAMHIRDKINSISATLPKDVNTPIVTTKNLDQQPILLLGFSSTSQSRSTVTEFLRRVIKPQIEAHDGIASAAVWGDDVAMQIWLNPVSLTSYHLTPQDVLNALKRQNVIASPGKTKGKYFNYTLNTTTALQTEDEFNDIIIKTINHVPIYIKDVGESHHGNKNDDFGVYYNNQPTTMIGVLTLPTSNPLTVVRGLLNKLPQIVKQLPQDVRMHLVLNRTEFISRALYEVIKTLFESIIIVVLVIYLFLGNIRAALIPSLTIPLSLIGICALMSFLHYSINTITLLAMVLGVGLVVDDAIIVIENCVKHLNQKCSSLQTAIVATQELIVPIIAMTITLAAVYIPIGLTGGLVGQLFKEFAFTLAGSVLVSGVLSLTLSPMLVGRLIHASQQKKKCAVWIEKLFFVIQEKYRASLYFLFQYQKSFGFIWVFIILLTGTLYVMTPSELMPTENQKFLLVQGMAPTHANLSYMEHYASQSHHVFKTHSDIDDVATILSPSNGYTAFLMLRHKEASLAHLQFMLQKELNQIPGLDFHLIVPNMLTGSGTPVQFVLQSTKDYKVLDHMAKKIEAEAMKSGVFLFLFDDLDYNNPEANFVVDPFAAASLSISMNDIASSLSLLMSNLSVAQYSRNDQSYDVVLKMLPQFQLIPEDLQNISVSNRHGASIPLESVATLTYRVVPTALNQFQKMNSVTIQGVLLQGQSLSTGLNLLAQLSRKHFPNQVAIDYAGPSRQFLVEGNRMLMIFGLAFLVIFLVLSIQFESFRDSFIILLGSVPMALFAALLPVTFGFASMNIYTQIGMLTLVGLISKHGILITRFANELKIIRHLTNHEAVIEAAILRLRPILMTTCAIVFGVLPLIFAQHAGSSSRQAIGIVIALGMSLGTLLTLFLLPIVYTLFSKPLAHP